MKKLNLLAIIGTGAAIALALGGGYVASTMNDSVEQASSIPGAEPMPDDLMKASEASATVHASPHQPPAE